MMPMIHNTVSNLLFNLSVTLYNTLYRRNCSYSPITTDKGYIEWQLVHFRMQTRHIKSFVYKYLPVKRVLQLIP